MALAKARSGGRFRAVTGPPAPRRAGVPLLAPAPAVRGIAIPVSGLIAGAATGLISADVPGLDLLLTLLLPHVVVSAFALYCAGGESRAVLLPVTLAFSVGGMLLSVRAWHDAWRTPLRAAFEAEASRHGRDAVTGVVTGTLRSDAAVRDDHVSLSLAVRSFEVGHPDAAGRRFPGGSDRAAAPLGGAAITVSGDIARTMAREWRRGRTLRVPVQLRRPRRYLNPGAPDDDRGSARRGIALIGTVKSGALVDVLARGSPWTEFGGAARDRIRRIVSIHVGRWSPRSAALVTAILIGDRAGLSRETVRTLQEAGTYHTVAISGGNIAILAALTLAVFRWSGMLGRGAMLTAIAAFLAYGELVESSPSVTRAIVSAVLYFAARTLDQRVEPVQAILVAAGLLVAADPLSLADPGFLLSFGATAGIVAVFTHGAAEVAGPTRRQGWGAVARQAVAMAVASLAAEAALLPIVATYFGRVTVAGLGLNVIAIPAMTVAQVAGMLIVPVAMISGPLATVLGGVAALAGVVLLESGRLVTWLPALSWRVAAPAMPVMVLYYAAVVAAAAAQRLRGANDRRVVWQRGATLAALASACWIAAEPWTVALSRGDGRLHIAFIDVGQGDAAFIRFPRGTTMLIDAGGSPSDEFDVGDRVVAPLLKQLGVRRVDTLVVTHGDLDHAGGAATVLREFQPFDLWEGVPVPPLPLLAQLRRQAVDAGTRWTTVQRHDSFVVDDVRVLVRHPGLPDWERQKVRNDDSIVLELRWHEVSVVLAGDVGREVERAIQDGLGAAPLRLLKVPHHGSLTSSSEAFVRALRPQVAVVSAGRGNPFNHPAAAVLERYAAVGAAVFRTDRDGAVMVDTDGHRLDVRGFTGRQASWPPP